MLGALNKDYRKYYVNYCQPCKRHWANDQGYPKYLTPRETAEMINGRASARYALCPDCKGGKDAKTNTKHSAR
jgi:hypothetical protein